MRDLLLRFARGRIAPFAFGVASATIVLFVWGSLDPATAIHDEASYLLQARLFGEGRWHAPPPPLPEFFEQFHVLVVPVLASKYPPGHALALTPGVALGAPAGVPLLLTGLTGGLLFVLARRLSGAWAALLAWMIWAAAPGNLDFRATFLSETTTSALWLAGWWCLLRWRESGEARWLAGVSTAVGLCAITRPLTAVAFAIPIGLYGLASWRRVGARGVAGALLPGALILGILPLWSWKTTGDPARTPLLLYAAQYMPYDVPGFGPVGKNPTRALPPDLDAVNRDMAAHRAARRPSDVPRIAADRAIDLSRDTWGRAAPLLGLAFLLGLVRMPGPGRFAVGTSLLLFAAYLTYWHDRQTLLDRPWTVYALEAMPALAYATALGLIAGVGWASDRLARKRGGRRFARAAALGIVAVVLAEALVFRALEARSVKQATLAGPSRFRELIRRIPDSAAVVFVRYAPLQGGHRSLVANVEDPARARVWRVYDRGADNVRLRRLAPGRRAYLYDASRDRLTPMPPSL